MKTAAEILRERGRCFGQLFDADGSCCPLGAIWLKYHEDVTDPYQYLQDADDEVYGDGANFDPDAPWIQDALKVASSLGNNDHYTVAEYNDSHNHTDEEVISLLEQAGV